jgi:hypothetical protein
MSYVEGYRAGLEDAWKYLVRFEDALEECIAANLAAGEADRNSDREKAAYQQAQELLADTADARAVLKSSQPGKSPAEEQV